MCDAEDFPLPPLASEPSPLKKRELYRAAGVGITKHAPSGAERQVVPNVLREDVNDINQLIAAEAEECAAKTRLKAEEERRVREAAARDAALRSRQERIDSAEAIALQRRVPSPIARFLAEHEDLNGKLTNYELRRLMQQQAIHSVARRNLLTTDKKKVLRSNNYPIEKQGAQSRDDRTPAPGEAIERWYKKFGGAPPGDV
uniref:Uncharacterized protein n=1 Tax=Neobodo designis TaxID=312471 RepID=A0A7S1M4M5_NEODS|mmetsp:Transcript_34095/g.105335  ORF Transcript_34095/g.105335 Transcript_34095/m.105335 type:complete len:201 (+) Transcript_34095:56-658(+)